MLFSMRAAGAISRLDQMSRKGPVEARARRLAVAIPTSPEHTNLNGSDV